MNEDPQARPAAAALDGLVTLLPTDALDVTPREGLLAEARTNIPDGVHLRGGWSLTVEGSRLTRAARA